MALGGQDRSPAETDSEAGMRVRGARELLGSLCGHVPACAEDIVEVIFMAGGATAAMVYPRLPWPRSLVARAVVAVAPSAPAAAILQECVAAVPSARHALRIADTGAVSLFFPIDISADRIAVLGAVLAPESDAAVMARLFAELGRPACGVAIEVDGAARARVRWYSMVGGGSARRAIAVAQRVLGIHPAGLEHLGRAAAGRAPGIGEDLVWNASMTSRGPAVKLELPSVGIAAALADTPSVPGRGTAAVVRAAASALGRDALSYLGLRAFRDGDVETSYYLDARAWLSGPQCR